ncbi:MAG TPA: four-carbon acid sugar kinase family protein, partial [Chloroflexota bacterium]
MLADDFTGACDAAGAFGAHHATRVVTRVPDGWPPETEVLSVDLDVRERCNAEASRAIARAIHRVNL